MLNIVIPSTLIDQLLTALSSTLVYSLLQGVALAAAGGLIILFTGKAKPATRYNLLLGVLVLFTISSVVTFGVQFGNLKPVAPVTVGHFDGSLQFTATDVVATTAAPQPINYMAQLSTFVSAHHNTIVLVWFLFICIKAIQMAVGLRTVFMLKRSGTPPAESSWHQRMEQMAQQLGVKQQIQLLESALAKVPMVIGNLKPVILMPLGLLTALSTAEIDAILMHELAHIRRRDYLVNLLQSMVEVVFFFNPAVLWVSQLIKTERENCCDDMALAQTDSKRNYIKALLSCEEYQQNGLAYSVAFSGQKHSLVSRVKRMVSDHNQSLTKFEKTLLTVLLVVSGLCLSAFAEREVVKKAVKQVVKAMTPSVEEKREVIAPVIAPPIVEPSLVSSVVVDTVPSINKPDTSIGARVANIFRSTFPGMAVISKGDSAVRIINNIAVTTSRHITTGVKFDLKEVIKRDSINRFVTIDSSTIPKARPSSIALINEMVKDGLIEKGKPVTFNVSEDELIINDVKQPQEIGKKYWLLRIGDPLKYAKHLEEKDRQERLVFTTLMIQMAKDKLIADGDEELSFTLNNDEFIVNGQKQPDAIFQRYHNNFVKPVPGGKMSWGYTTQR